MAKISRSLGKKQKRVASSVSLGLHGSDKNKNTVWGSDALSTYIDVLSVGPIGGVIQTFYDKTDLASGEFPNTDTFEHDGTISTTPWNDYPYVERTFKVGKNADAIDNQDTATTTTLNRDVSEIGVKGIRLIFNTSGFNQRDNKGRRKQAIAYFSVTAHDEDGTVINKSNGHPLTNFISHGYFCQSAASVALNLEVPDAYLDQVWGYKVTMKVRGRLHSSPVSGSWSCALVTEVYKDTQKYKDVAFVSGNIVSTDVSGKIPSRTYLVDGYEVAVPQLNGNGSHNGQFVEQTSNSHAWNILAVLTNSKWGGNLPLDRINLDSFIRFEAYCAEIVDGERRYTFSYHLTKATNFFRLAHLMAGSADAKLAEDENGRIGIMIDQKKSARRIVTSYDIVGEKVKRTTTNNNKRINYVSGQFDDESNSYEKTIIHVEDSQAITDHGLIQKKLILNACTNRDEAERSIQRLLSTSQFVSETYSLKVGPSHADVVIGDILAVYDRKHARIDYCGKTAAGSTATVLKIDPRTPINTTSLTGTLTLSFQLETKDAAGAYEHVEAQIASVAGNEITLTSPLAKIPEDFTSFGISASGLEPTLMKVLGLNASKGSIGIEAIAYNDSLYDYVDGERSDILKPITRILPDTTALDITNLVVTNEGSAGVKAVWTGSAPTGYVFVWYKGVGSNKVQLTAPVNTTNTEVSYNIDMELDTYTIAVYGRGMATTGSVFEAAVNLSTVVLTNTSSIALPTNFGDNGGDYAAFTDRSTFLTWDYVAHADHVGFRLEITTTEGNFSVSLPIADREYEVTEIMMIEEFGTPDYPRQIEAKITAIDKDLNGSATVTRIINNLPIPAPIVTTDSDGNVTLAVPASITELPSDYVSAYVSIWKTSDGEDTAVFVEATEIEDDGTINILVPDGTILRDTSLEQTSYTFKAGWIDSFGEIGTLETTLIKDFGRYVEIPDPVELTRVGSLTDSSARIYFEHSGDHLNAVQIYAKESTSAGAWVTWGNPEIIKEITGQTPSVKGDYADGEGHIDVTGLAFNKEYVFTSKAKNVNSVLSEYSNEVTGGPIIDVASELDVAALIDARNFMDEDSAMDIIDDLNFGMDPRSLFVEGVSDAFETVKNTIGVVKETRFRIESDLSMIENINQIQVEFQGLDFDTNARITEIDLVRTTAESAIAQSVEDLEVKMGEDIGASALITSLAYAAADGIIAQSVVDLDIKMGDDIEASAESMTTAYGNADEVIAQSVTDLDTKMGEDIEASAVSLTQVISDNDTAMSGRVDTLDARFVGMGAGETVSQASASAATTAIAAANLATVSTVSTLASRVGDNEGEIFTVQGTASTNASSISAIETIQTSRFGGLAEGTSVSSAISTQASTTLASANAATLLVSEALDARFVGLDANETVSSAISTSATSVLADANTAAIAREEVISTAVGENETRLTATELVATGSASSVLALETSWTATFGAQDGTGIAAAAVMTANAKAQEAVSLSASGILYGKFNTMQGSVDENSADITATEEAIVATDGVVASQGVTLTTQSDNIVAIARDSATAGTGVCSLGEHDNRIECEDAGGTWTQDTFATSMNAVQISDGHGNTTTVGNHLSTSRDFEGNMAGEYTAGIDSNGVFTGMRIINANGSNGTNRDILFQSDTVKFQKSDGTNNLHFDGTKWVFAGTLEAGTVVAEEIVGDLVDIGRVATSIQTWNGSDNPNNGLKKKVLVKIRVPKVPYKRNVTFTGVTVHHNGVVSGDSKLEYTVQNYTSASGTTMASGGGGHVLTSVPLGGDKIVTMPTISAVLNANLEGYFELWVSAYNRTGGVAWTYVHGQNVIVTHGRIGDTISQY